MSRVEAKQAVEKAIRADRAYLPAYTIWYATQLLVAARHRTPRVWPGKIRALQRLRHRGRPPARLQSPTGSCGGCNARLLGRTLLRLWLLRFRCSGRLFTVPKRQAIECGRPPTRQTPTFHLSSLPPASVSGKLRHAPRESSAEAPCGCDGEIPRQGQSRLQCFGRQLSERWRRAKCRTTPKVLAAL